MPVNNADGDIEFPLNSDIPARVPEGDYDLVFLKGDKKHMFGGGERSFLWFKIITPGDWMGTQLFMTCTVPLKGKWSPSHKFWLAWVLAAGKRPTRGDRMSTRIFRNKVFRGRVRIVTKTARQTLRTKEQQYSVVDELAAVQAGGK
ncbi:MAG: hypothetical protein HRU82_09780 [Nitrospira sp.]|nr:MAG: hypothetical protein HRU82_09780 [Nitrospira sp.]